MACWYLAVPTLQCLPGMLFCDGKQGNQLLLLLLLLLPASLG
jgi:hypothetical protein